MLAIHLGLQTESDLKTKTKTGVQLCRSLTHLFSNEQWPSWGFHKLLSRTWLNRHCKAFRIVYRDAEEVHHKLCVCRSMEKSNILIICMREKNEKKPSKILGPASASSSIGTYILELFTVIWVLTQGCIQYRQ